MVLKMIIDILLKKTVGVKVKEKQGRPKNAPDTNTQRKDVDKFWT